MNRRTFLARGSAAAGIITRAWAAKIDSDNPLAQTTACKIRGIVQGKIKAFKGIPYGASTEGAGRFLPPSKPQPWTGVRDALEVGPKAPQARAGGGLVPEYAPMDWNGPMSEDVLHLNLWTPGLKDNKKRPVMLWLHGGGYARSSANSDLYNGTNLATR